MCDCGLSIPAPGVMTGDCSGKQACCLLERVVKEREHLGYTGSFVMHDMKSEEVSGVKQLTFGRWEKRVLAQSSAWLRAQECLILGYPDSVATQEHSWQNTHLSGLTKESRRTKSHYFQ